MQQPLSHLYFTVVLEDVSNSNFGLSGLITTSQKISKVWYYVSWVCPLVVVGVCWCSLSFVYMWSNVPFCWCCMALNSRVLATTHFFEGPTILACSVSIGLKDTPVPVVVSNAVVALWRKRSWSFYISKSKQLYKSSSEMSLSILTYKTILRSML